MPSLGTQGFRSSRAMGTAVVAMLWVGIGLRFLQMPTLWSLHELGATPPGDQPEAVTAVVGLLGIFLAFLGALLFLSTAVVFLIWIHGACANLPRLGATFTRVTPGLAVGGFFIPFYNIAHGYIVMRELIGFGRSALAPVDTLSPPSAPIVAWWWGLYLASGLFGMMPFGPAFGLLNLVLLSGAGVLLARMVKEVVTAQDYWAAQLAAAPVGDGPFRVGQRPMP